LEKVCVVRYDGVWGVLKIEASLIRLGQPQQLEQDSFVSFERRPVGPIAADIIQFRSRDLVNFGLDLKRAVVQSANLILRFERFVEELGVRRHSVPPAFSSAVEVVLEDLGALYVGIFPDLALYEETQLRDRPPLVPVAASMRSRHGEGSHSDEVPVVFVCDSFPIPLLMLTGI
jgi:hypothetical protein